MTKFCEKALFDVFRQLMLFDIFWWALGINLIAPFLADIGFHVPDNDHPFELWESPWCEQQRLKSMRIGCNVNLNYLAHQIAYWEDLFPKNWDDRTKFRKDWFTRVASSELTSGLHISHYKTLGTSCLAFVPKRWELWLSKGTFPSRPFPLPQCYIVVVLVNPVPMLMWIWGTELSLWPFLRCADFFRNNFFLNGLGLFQERLFSEFSFQICDIHKSFE